MCIRDSISVKELPGHHAIAPADNARPVLYDEFDMTAAALTDNGTRTEMSAEYHAAVGTLPTGLDEGEYIIRRSSDSSQQWWYKSPESSQGGNLGRTYEITYTVSDDSTEAGSQGELETEAGRVLINTTAGTHTITAVSNQKELRFIARVGNSYKISNVSHKRVNTAFDERGAELVSQGDGTEVSDWSTANNAVISSVGGKIRVENGAASFAFAYLALTLEVGKTYEFKADMFHGNDDALVRIGSNETGAQNKVYDSGFIASQASVTTTFTAVTSTTYVRISTRTNTIGQYAEFDNISVCLLYTSPSPRDRTRSRMPSSA